MNEQYVDVALYIGYVLVILCTVFAIVLPLISAFSNPKGLLKPVVGFVGLIAIVSIGYVLADGTAMGDASSNISKWVGGVIVAMYLLIGAAIVGIIYSEVSKVFK